MRTKTAYARLDKLAANIRKYAHRWGANPSNRLAGWVNEYDAVKDELIASGYLRWAEYCASRKIPTDVNGGDHLA